MNTEENKEKRPQLRVLLDTNILVSATINPQGRAGRAWEFAISRRFRSITSPYILREFARILRTKFSVSDDEIRELVRTLADASVIVQPTTTLQVVRDPKDNPIIECAVDGNANIIVSYDNDLLSLKVYNNIPILHVVDLLHLLGE